MNGFTPRAYTNLHHRYTKPNTIAYFLRAYYVLLHGRLFFYALFVLLLREINWAILFFSKRGLIFDVFSAIQYRGQNKRPLRTLKIEYTAHRHITCNPSRKVGAPRSSERKGARNTYTLLFVGRQEGDDAYRG